jgi:apolipoprotein N-acyltransferase
MQQSQLKFTPISWSAAWLVALIAVACFHAAYIPAHSGLFSLGIVGYVICLTQLSRLRTTRQSFYSGLVIALACYAPHLDCFWRIFGPVAISLWTILAIWIGFFVALTHVAIARLGFVKASLLVPFLWTGLEYFRSELYYLRFSWMNVGYAFAESPLVSVSFLGMYGVGFSIAVIAAALIVREKTPFRFALYGLLLFFALYGLLPSIIFPMVSKIRSGMKSSLLVAGVQLEFPTEKELMHDLDKLLVVSPTNSFSRRGATNVDLVVLSEYTFMEGEPTQQLKDWCRENRKFMIVGGKQELRTNFYNTAFVISTNGEVIFKQVKCTPIQFMKDGLPATEQNVWDSPWGKIGICICYDLSYTRVTDELIRQGAQMLVVPTMDVVDWGKHQHELHARVAPTRAAEYGVPIFRLASSGISQGVNAFGKVEATAPFPGEGETIFYGAVVPKNGGRPIDRWLGPVCVVVTIILVIWVVLGNIRKKWFGARSSSDPSTQSGAKDTRTPNARASNQSHSVARSVWSACVFSAAFPSCKKPDK